MKMYCVTINDEHYDKIKKLGYVPKISLHEGLKKTYQWYEKYYSTNIT